MTNVPNKRYNIIPHDKDMNEEEPNNRKRTRCFECGGYGHIRPEFPNFLRKQKMELTTTWYDSKSEGDRETCQ